MVYLYRGRIKLTLLRIVLAGSLLALLDVVILGVASHGHHGRLAALCVLGLVLTVFGVLFAGLWVIRERSSSALPGGHPEKLVTDTSGKLSYRDGRVVYLDDDEFAQALRQANMLSGPDHPPQPPL